MSNQLWNKNLQIEAVKNNLKINAHKLQSTNFNKQH